MTELAKEYKKRNSFFRKWGAVFILAIFFAVSWGGQFATQLSVEKSEAQMHGQEFSMQEFWPQFWSSTFENWQSEWLQLATQALLISGFASVLFRKQDEEHYKTQLMIERLQTELREHRRAGAKR